MEIHNFFLIFLMINFINCEHSQVDLITSEPQFKSDKKNITNITHFDCNRTVSSRNCEPERYTCKNRNNNTDCTCKDKYMSLDDHKENYCTVEKKKQLTAFLLELFVGFGAGHFYRQNYLMAGLKLAAFIFGLYIICLFPLTAKFIIDCCASDVLVAISSIFFYLCACGLAFWYIYDLVQFGKNKYPDYRFANYPELLHW